MGGREKPHTDKYKANTNDWNYDAFCTFTSLPVSDFENFKCLVFVVQSVQMQILGEGAVVACITHTSKFHD
jgi:hypothetical protein